VITNHENPGSPRAVGSRREEVSRNAFECCVPDDELEKRAAHVLIWNALVPPNSIGVTADLGKVTLTGTVEWDYQRNAAEAAVRPMSGVVALTNNIAIRRTNSAG
jgi:osmotically-inducible protein OsmY